ncbi:MAG: site-specific integrase [Pirellulales bacterium]|nr:site-specific integrase [Pirellulales bacterium]
MASISKQPGGRRVIQFTGADSKRRTIRLGKLSQRTAEGVKLHVERLVVASLTRHPVEDDTARWLGKLDDTLYGRLAAVGLVPKRASAMLGGFLDDYLKSRADVKLSTATVLGHTKRNLLDYFGADKPLRDITPGDADGFRLHLVKEGLAENTIRRRCGIAKQFLRAAVRSGLVLANPFADLKAAVQRNASRYYFVSRDEARLVLDACPDAQWRLLFVLSRYGGLRCPSEHLALRWDDIDWERERMTVRSPKTEHHEGGESRVVPIFPELRPYLDAVWDEASERAEYVITIRRDATKNLRTRFTKIIRRAGLKPWPKLFQNLRSTRQTELAEQFPGHVVCDWIGNSQAVATTHYLQVTDEHYKRAVEGGKQALQNPTQSAHGKARHEATSENRDEDKPHKVSGFRTMADDDGARDSCLVGPPGFEPGTKGL